MSARHLGDFLRPPRPPSRPSSRACRSTGRSDFMREVALPDAVHGLPKLGFFPGSTIGNMVARTAVDLLRSMRATLGQSSLLLIGWTDQGRRVLEAAYDDAEGVTAEFNLNLAGGSTANSAARYPSTSAHVARWNDTFARIGCILSDRRLRIEVSSRRFLLPKARPSTPKQSQVRACSKNTLLLAGGWTRYAAGRMRESNSR